MTMTINSFSDLNQVCQTLQGASDTSRISQGKSLQINGKAVKVGVTDRGLAVRTALLDSLNKTFANRIPATVLKAMKADKAFSGFSVGKDGKVKATNHPLTARRLRQIINEVKAVLVNPDEKLDAVENTESCELDAGSRAVDVAINKALKSAHKRFDGFPETKSNVWGDVGKKLTLFVRDSASFRRREVSANDIRSIFGSFGIYNGNPNFDKFRTELEAFAEELNELMSNRG